MGSSCNRCSNPKRKLKVYKKPEEIKIKEESIGSLESSQYKRDFNHLQNDYNNNINNKLNNNNKNEYNNEYNKNNNNYNEKKV